MRFLAEIIIPAAGAVLLCIVVFLMKGVLSFVIGLPVWMIAIAGILAGVVIFIQLNLLTAFFRYGREGFTFMEARRKGMLVICDVEVGTNNAEFILGEKTDPKSPLFKDEKSGVKVDPSMISAYSEPMRFPGGLNIVGYAYRDMLPQTTKNHLGVKAIIQYFRNGEETPDRIDPEDKTGKKKIVHPAKTLAFLTDNEKFELIRKPEHFLEVDLKTKLGSYFKTKEVTDGQDKRVIYYRQFQKDGKWFEQTVEVPELINAVQSMKADINKLPIAMDCYFSMTEAFKNNNSAFTAQHVSALKSLLTQLITEDIMSKVNLWTYGLIGMGILAVFFGGVFVLIKFTGKG
jgi:hypothetical protein